MVNAGLLSQLVPTTCVHMAKYRFHNQQLHQPGNRLNRPGTHFRRYSYRIYGGYHGETIGQAVVASPVDLALGTGYADLHFAPRNR